jgi:hypothetical protein
MVLAGPAGPPLGARWQNVSVASVVADAGNVDPAAVTHVYYALPLAPSVAQDASGTPVFALTLVLSRTPDVGESSVHPLIEQGVLSLDLELNLRARRIEEIAARLTDNTKFRKEVQRLFARDARFELWSGTANSDAHSRLAGARTSGGTTPRASLGCTLNRDQTLAVLAALDGGASRLTLRTSVSYRASGAARRHLSAEWASVHDFITAHTKGESLTGDDLRRLFSNMYRQGVVRCSVMSSATERAPVLTADDLDRLFAAFARQATVILRRLAPQLSAVDGANVYALRARPSVGFRLEHEEECIGDAIETVTFDAPLETPLNGLLSGRDRDAFIRLVSLKSGSIGGSDAGAVSTPPRPQRFTQRPASRDTVASRQEIALAASEGQLKSVALKLRPEMASEGAATRNANVMIASGIARPLSAGTSVQVADKLDWYLDDWRFNGTNDKLRHLPIVGDPAAPLWQDRIDGNRFWYAPVFEVVQPAPNADPATSPFLFSFERIGETPSGPALEGEIRFTLRRTMSEQTRSAIAARPQAVVAPVPTANLAVSLVLPFLNETDNELRRHTCPCTVEDNGTMLTARVGLTTQWLRIAYTLLSHPGASAEPARVSVAFSYSTYAVVPRFGVHLAFGHKEATIPVMYSAAQVRERQNELYVDATTATLNFAGGTVMLKREMAARESRVGDTPVRDARRGGGVALAATAVVARPQVFTAAAVATTVRPSVVGLGQIATPIARPGINLADIIAETKYAERTLLRQEQHDAVFPCSSLGAFYRDTTETDVAIGCRPSMELGRVAYRRYERVPELDRVDGGETQYQVFRSMQHPGRFLVLPARYTISRHAPGTPDAYEPRVLLYSDEDPLRALATPIVFTAELQPDIAPHARRALDLKLALLAQTPVIEYPTAIECDVAFVFHAMDSTPVTAFRTPDSFSVSVACTAADWPLLFTRLQTGGVVGQVRFGLGDGTELSSILSVDLRHVSGPWTGGPVSCDVTAGSVRLTNRIDRPVAVHEMLIVSGATSRTVPVERTLAPAATDTIPVAELAADAEAYAAYTTPATPEVIEALANAVERIHVNVIFTNQILFSNHALMAMSVFVRRQGTTTPEQLSILPDTTLVQADFLLPLTEYIARPVVQLRIVKAFADGGTQTKEWFDWDLTQQGFVIGLTWELVQS